MLHRSLRSSIRGVQACEGSEKRSDYCDDLSTVFDMLGSSLDDEESALGIDTWDRRVSRAPPLSQLKHKTYANMLSYSASETSVIGFFRTLPTVLITMSILPKSSLAASNSLFTAPSVVRSP